MYNKILLIAKLDSPVNIDISNFTLLFLYFSINQKNLDRELFLFLFFFSFAKIWALVSFLSLGIDLANIKLDKIMCLN